MFEARALTCDTSTERLQGGRVSGGRATVRFPYEVVIYSSATYSVDTTDFAGHPLVTRPLTEA